MDCFAKLLRDGATKCACERRLRYIIWHGEIVLLSGCLNLLAMVCITQAESNLRYWETQTSSLFG